jgi:hypothetical protein
LFSCQGENRQYFDQYLDDDIDHCRIEWHLGINMEAFEEISDTFEEVNECVITCVNSNSGLIYSNIRNDVEETERNTYHEEYTHATNDCICRLKWHLQT